MKKNHWELIYSAIFRRSKSKNELNSQQFGNAKEREAIKEIRDVLAVISNNLAIPLYLLFWICDIIYVPHLKYEFLLLRLAIIPLCMFTRYFASKINAYHELQRLCVVYIFVLASCINFMIYRIGLPDTPYYAGLNLVALGTLAFIPWQRKYYSIAVLGIYGPYIFLGFYWSKLGLNNLSGLIINIFFISGTITISLIMRLFNDHLRNKELKSRLLLESELQERQKIIDIKSAEAVRTATLAKQFSPQVVKAISDGVLDIHKGIRRAKICVIFVDIVKSTDRISRIDKDNINIVIDTFLNDTSSVMLKHGITIDKFLGDGLLGFSNAPVEVPNYIENVVNAAVEIRKNIISKRDLYIEYWLNELQIRVGVASGFADVGFYGSDSAFRSYTAIGKVVNLASRLCSIAEPNQILVTSDVASKCSDTNYSIKDSGLRKIKGFEDDMIRVYSVETNYIDHAKDSKIPICPNNHGLLSLNVDNNGIYNLSCIECGYIHNVDNLKKVA